MAKSLMRLGSSLKSLTTSPKYLGTVRLCHSQNDKTELTTANTKISNETTGSTTTAIETTVATKTPSEAKKLFELFTNDVNPISLIVNIEENKDKIDGRHVVQALTSMHKFYEKSRYPLVNVQKSPQFVSMVKHLNRHIRTLETPQIIQALKILNLFQVNSSTTVVQNLLQLLRVTINELHPHEIYYLAFLLKHMKPSHLGNAIYTALPEVFQARLKTKIDVEDLKELSSALKFATNYTNNKEIIGFLIDKINKYNDTVNLNYAVSIFQSLCKIESRADDYYNVLSRMKDEISKDLDNLQEHEVMSIISKTTSKILQGYDQFYDPIFLDLLINQVIRINCDCEKAFRVLGQINPCDHIHLALLQYITLKCQNDLEVLSRFPKNMQKLAQGLSNSNYLPPNWEELKTEIFDNYKKLPDHVTIAYLALYLAALDDCNLEMIEHIFKLDQNPDQLTPAYRQTICELYQFVKTLHPEYTGPWPLDEIVSSFRNLNFEYESTKYPLRPALNKLLGGPAHVKTNVRTDLGHHIDYLVVLQDNLPITIESNVTSEDPKAPCYVEDLNIPQDCEKVAICYIPRELCGRNIPIPNAHVRIKKKSLKAMSFKVVLVPEDTWLSMPESEILPYLQHMIGFKSKNKSSEIDSKKLAKANR